MLLSNTVGQADEDGVHGSPKPYLLRHPGLQLEAAQGEGITLEGLLRGDFSTAVTSRSQC